MQLMAARGIKPDYIQSGPEWKTLPNALQLQPQHNVQRPFDINLRLSARHRGASIHKAVFPEENKCPESEGGGFGVRHTQGRYDPLILIAWLT